MNRREFLPGAACVLMALSLPSAWAQFYPARPIRLVVGYAPGAQSDAIARLVAQSLGTILEASVVVENRPGANGTIGVDLTARSPADGYTLGFAGGGSLTLAPATDSSVRFDVQRDLVPLARVARVPLVLAARSDLPVQTATQLIEFARDHPGSLTYASSGATAQAAIESLKAAEKLDIIVVPYKGTAPALLDVVAGRVDLVLADVGAVAPHVRSGALHLIGNAGSKRAAAFSHVPTMAEEGVADFVWESWQGVVAPAATPGEIVDLLKSSLVRMRASAAFREGLEGLGFEPIDEGPEAFSAVLRDETERFRKLVSRSRTAEKE